MTTATLQPTDTRRIAEHDADFQRLYAATRRQLAASVARFVRDLRGARTDGEESAAQSAFISRHTDLMRAAYHRAYVDGQRDFYGAVSRKPGKWAQQPDAQRVRRALTFYAAPSIAKMAHEAVLAKRRMVTPPQPQVTLAEGDDEMISLDDWLTSTSVRVDLQANLAWSGLQQGYYDGPLTDPANPYYYLYWDLEPLAQHCFPAGTSITVPGGAKPIHMIQVGDLVETLTGPRRVTRIFRSVYHGQLAHVQAGGESVVCTPNHPFLTQRGWIAAEDLRDGDQAVLAQHGGHFVARHIRFPDAYNGESTRTQVGILGAVSTLLRRLALSQRLKARVAVPVFPVGLNNERADTNVHDELILDDCRRLELDTQVCQDRAQAVFQFAGLVTLDPLMSRAQLHCNRFNFFRMLRTPSANLGQHLGTLHRVVADHVRSCGFVNKASLRLSRQVDPQLSRLACDGAHCETQRSSNRLGAIMRVVFAQIGDLFGSPLLVLTRIPTSAALASVAAGAEIHGPVADMPAFGARLELARLGMGEVQAQVAIPARNAAKAIDMPPLSRLLERLSAVPANELPNHSDAPSVHAPSIPQKQTVVYNFEVEGVHHYIADGFVVHNCDDCPDYAAGSPYTPPGSGVNELDATPGDGHTACGAACKCSLRYGNGGRGDVSQLTWNQAFKFWAANPDQLNVPPSIASLIQGMPQPLALPSRDDLTVDQLIALDDYRDASIQWDMIRGDLAPLPGLFSEGVEDWTPPSWDGLTPAQQEALVAGVMAMIDWSTATDAELQAAFDELMNPGNGGGGA